MIFTPATVVPTHLLRLLDRPDLLAAFRDAEEHPEKLVRRQLREAPEVDWEVAD